MKFSNIIFLCLLVLFALISCSDAGKRNKGVGRKGGKGKGKNNGGVRKFKGGKKGGRKTRKNNKNDDDDDEEDNKKSKRKGGKKNKSAKKTRKAGKKGKKFGKKTRGSDAKTLKKGGKGKKKSKGCRHPDGADRINGNILTAKVSGAVPCYKIECQGSGKKFKWMYMEQKCKTCTFGNIQYMVGYASEQKCYGTDGKECYIMMCMEDGQFRRQGWPCVCGPEPDLLDVPLQMTFADTPYVANYADSSSEEFNTLAADVATKFAESAGKGIDGFVEYKLTSVTAASTRAGGIITFGYCVINISIVIVTDFAAITASVTTQIEINIAYLGVTALIVTNPDPTITTTTTTTTTTMPTTTA